MDGDGNLDLLVITGDGRIHKVMCISPGSVQGYGDTGLLGTPEQDPVKVIHTTAKDQSLATLDVDGDGRQDVLIGDSNDRVWLLKNVSTSGAASFSLRPLTVSRTSAAFLEIIAPRQIRLYFALPTFAGDTVISYHNLPTNGRAALGTSDDFKSGSANRYPDDYNDTIDHRHRYYLRPVPRPLLRRFP